MHSDISTLPNFHFRFAGLLFRDSDPVSDKSIAFLRHICFLHLVCVGFFFLLGLRISVALINQHSLHRSFFAPLAIRRRLRPLNMTPSHIIHLERKTLLTSVHPEIGKFGRDQGVGKNLTAGIWLIFRGLNFSRNADIGQIGHLWMGTNEVVK
jgi:hypothetical protein